jgi:bifunctional non-homologous end joining protein LigD
MGANAGGDENCVWVTPRVVVQIEFGEWTPDGHLRHSKFSGLRDDKDPSEVLQET